MNRLEEQLRHIHMSPAQQRFMRQVGTLDKYGLIDSADTTAIERKAVLQLAQDVLEGKPLYQVSICTDEEGPRAPTLNKMHKLDLGGYVYTDTFAVPTFTFALLFGLAMRTYIEHNDKRICLDENDGIAFNHSLLAAQLSYVKGLFGPAANEPDMTDRLAQVFAYIKAILLTRGKIKIPTTPIEDFNDSRRVLARYIPKRSTWSDYKQALITKLPFPGDLGQIDMLAELSDITVDSLPGVKFLYRNIDGLVIDLKEMSAVEEATIGDFTTDGIFNDYYGQVLLTAELLDIANNEQEIELLNAFKFYYKG